MADEKLSLQELEVRLKEQDLRLKEAEVRAKEKDLATSKWQNPLVLGLFAAAIALVGNVVVTTINSKNTEELERSRTRSTLILEAIKTNGDTNAACRNLVFFASLGLIEDTNQTITGACPGNVQGIPSVSAPGPDKIGGTLFYGLTVQAVDSKGAPISDVSVQASLVPSTIPLEIPGDFVPTLYKDKAYDWILRHTSTRCISEKDGNCYLGMAPSGRFIAILAKKNEYIGSRTNTLFTGNSIVVVLQKTPPSH